MYYVVFSTTAPENVNTSGRRRKKNDDKKTIQKTNENGKERERNKINVKTSLEWIEGRRFPSI